MSQIAVIVPVYNAEKTLARCVDSVLAQTFSDLSLILVDDGSTDRSPALCDAYAKADPRISVIHQENGGLSAARNAGIEAQLPLDNRYLFLLDSDDSIEPTALEELLSTALETEADITVCLFRHILFDGSIEEIPAEDLSLLREETLTGRDFLERFLYGGTYCTPVAVVVWNKLYRKELFTTLRFDGRIAEDEKICSSLFRFDRRVALLPRRLHNYYETKGSLMTKPLSPAHLSVLDTLLHRLEEFSDSPSLLSATKKLYCDLVTEYFCVPSMKGQEACFTSYLPPFRRLRKELSLDRKTALRFFLFARSPRLYRLLLRLRRP